MSHDSPETANVLYGIARNLLRERDYGELLTNILDMTIQALGADRGCVIARERGGFRATAARNFRNETLAERETEISTTIAGMAVEEGRVILVHNARESAVLRDKKSVRRLQLRSVLCAPLIVSNVHLFDDLEGVVPRVTTEDDLVREITLCFTNKERNASYLAKQLRDWRTGIRTNSGDMPKIAAKLSDQDIDALATFLASKPRVHANGTAAQ